MGYLAGEISQTFQNTIITSQKAMQHSGGYLRSFIEECNEGNSLSLF